MVDTHGSHRERRARPTLADVAKLAGVSPTTVSLVVNDRPGSGIPAPTRDRVLAAVQQLGYRPNRMAANLRRQRTGALGLHVDPSVLKRPQLYTLTVLPALVRAADERGYHVVVFTDHGDRVAPFTDLVATHAVDGFVLVDCDLDDERARYLAETGVPFTAMGRLGPDLPQTWVDIDNAAAMRLALDHLSATGHSDVLFVAPDSNDYWWQERIDGYLDWLNLRSGSEPRLVRGSLETLQEQVAEVLRQDPRPTGLLAAGDAVVVPCYRAAAQVGLAIGRDLAIVGFDPQLWMLDPRLTTLDIPMDKVARLLMDGLLGQLEGRHGNEGTLVPVHLVPGESG